MRPSKLSKVSIEALRSEIQRRVGSLASLVRQRDALNRQIAELEALTAQPESVAAPARKIRKTRRTPKTPTIAKPVRRRRQRRQFAQTGEEFVLSLLQGGKKMTTAELVAVWKESGRGGKVENKLTRLFQAGKLQRKKLATGRGSEYSLP